MHIYETDNSYGSGGDGMKYVAHSYTSPQRGRLSAWLHDDGASESMMMGAGTLPGATGVGGVVVGKNAGKTSGPMSASYYVYFFNAAPFYVSNVPISKGWHHFELDFTGTGVVVYIDGLQQSHAGTATAFTIVAFGGGWRQSQNFYVDDFSFGSIGALDLPSVTITSPPNFSTVDVSATTITGNAAGGFAGLLPVAKVEVTQDYGSTWQLATTTDSWATWKIDVKLAKGFNSVLARVTDIAGSSSTAPMFITYTPPPPTITFTSPPNNTTVTVSDLTVTGTAAAATGSGFTVTKVEVTQNYGSTWQPVSTTDSWATWKIAVKLAKEFNSLQARVTDSAGSTKTVSLYVTYAPPPPTITFTSPANNSTVSVPGLTVTGTAAAATGSGFTVTKVEVTQNYGSTWLLVSSTDSWATWKIAVKLAKGFNSLQARVTDSAGSTATASLYVTYTPPPPTIAITSPSNNSTVSVPDLTVTGTAAVASGSGFTVTKVEVTQNYGSTWQLVSTTDSWATWNVTVTLAKGLNSVQARVTDSAGSTATVSVYVTYTPPLVDAE